eukprot:CAMPEP_0117447388 /NCGR_PEP_ID=MMETSP0759-20121206/6850_1 /TAXON_ID=63605 /ORGANISM="Percolomonas cosmopolitus, Strain WS" /LENGTH=152 /DNA_ID=CAMNT_0005239723 /DNA_START=120 /DNA_END=578 /DNA_ORIENTATION=-
MSRLPYSTGITSPTSPGGATPTSPYSTSSPLSPQLSPYPHYSPGATSGVSSPVHSQFSSQHSMMSYASPITQTVQTPQAPQMSPGGTQPTDTFIPQQPMDDVVVAQYICGDCGKDTELRIGKDQSDAVACKECGEKILYKKRSRIPMQYEAR